MFRPACDATENMLKLLTWLRKQLNEWKIWMKMGFDKKKTVKLAVFTHIITDIRGFPEMFAWSKTSFWAGVLHHSWECNDMIFTFDEYQIWWYQIYIWRKDLANDFLLKNHKNTAHFRLKTIMNKAQSQKQPHPHGVPLKVCNNSDSREEFRIIWQGRKERGSVSKLCERPTYRALSVKTPMSRYVFSILSHRLN